MSNGPEIARPRAKRLRRFLVPAVVVAVTAALYAPTFLYSMQWDDKEMLVNSVTLSGPDTLSCYRSR